MNGNFRTIDKSELEDFDTECRVRGIDPKEFQIREHDIIETPPNSVIFFTNAKLTITRKTISRTYDSGNATHWVADFADDLRKGVFN